MTGTLLHKLAATAMIGIAALSTGCLGDGGGGSSSAARDDARAMFDPVKMQIHPVFTKVSDWTGDGKPDGIEVLAEFRDSFGDSTKAAGTFVFEVYAFQPNSADPRGPRIANAFVGPVDSPETQRQRWSNTSRCYAFRLAFDGANAKNAYVLSATFTPVGAKRLFDQMVLGK